MSDDDNVDHDEGGDDRIVAACEQCGSVYAAIHRPDGEILPIGSRLGCASCGGRRFEPIPELTDAARPSNRTRRSDEE